MYFAMKLEFLTVILLIGFCTQSYADVYEYIDEEGNVHFSDSPSHDGYVLISASEQPAFVENEIVANDKLPIQELLITPSQLQAQIEQSAQNNQLDSELIHAVIHVESAFKAKAQSKKGAQGLMQLMPATAKRVGVKNSFDPAQNIEGGAKYLKELLTMFNNDVTLAVAAYNAGENAVIKYGYRVPPYKETQAYVPKVLNTYKALLKQRRTEI